MRQFDFYAIIKGLGLILYDKGGTFLGMGQNELLALGYEDIEEFKNSFKDFADLFVEQPGYISKFKNFSWIDYILHSGAPNRNVIIRHKDGTNLETELFISEIYLINEISNFTALYSIDLGILKPNPQIIHRENQDTDSFRINKETNHTNFQDIGESLSQDYEEDYQEIKEKSTYGTNLNISEDEIIHIKNTNDVNESKEEEILQENNLEMYNIADDTEEPIDYRDKITQEQENIEQENIEYENIEYENIDFTQIAENTGMNLEDIAEFISEFIAESKSYIENFPPNEIQLDIELARKKAAELKDIAFSLNMQYISQTLQTIATSDNEISKKIGRLQKQLKNLEEQLF